MMNGVRFGDYHSWEDFHLILGSKKIGSPEPKTAELDIPGRDGTLDLTEYFGETKYKNRPLSFEFSTIVPRWKFLTLFSKVQNRLHGQRMKITIDEDPNFYYVGRVTVSEWKADKNVGTLTVDVDAEPYKYREYETMVTVPSGNHNVVLKNLRQRVSPTFETEGLISITHNGNNYQISDAGSFRIPEIILEPGNNEFYFSGAEVLVRYQEGGL